MTICFNGNTYKYEIEAVMKLFLPLQSFEFIYENNDTLIGDYCIITQLDNGLGYNLSVSVLYEGQKVNNHIAVDYDEDCELSLCRLLFVCMQKITGITPQWGCLTGIRPVKKVNQLDAKGFDKKQIFDYLKEKYYVSDEKLKLAYDTAETQKKYLNSFDPKSFSLYVSIPFCPSRCSYCSFVSHSIESSNAKKLLPEYVEKLCSEIKQTAEIVNESGMHLDTIYIGGGTPTTLDPQQLERVMKEIQKNFDISEIREYTVEAGRADTISEENLRIIKNNGATRISVNPQTMNDDVLKVIGRKHTAAQTIEAFRLARSLGFDNINMDLIAGLPTDTIDSFKKTLNSVIELDPENITVHTLTIKRSSNLFSSADVESDGSISEMISYAYETLKKKEYNPYYLYRQKNTVGNLENVGYAKSETESLYNIYIMEEIQTIIAVGAGGSSKLVNPVTNKIERLFNYKYPYEYISRNEQMLEKKQQLKEFCNNIL